MKMKFDDLLSSKDQEIKKLHRFQEEKKIKEDSNSASSSSNDNIKIKNELKGHPLQEDIKDAYEKIIAGEKESNKINI